MEIPTCCWRNLVCISFLLLTNTWSFDGDGHTVAETDIVAITGQIVKISAVIKTALISPFQSLCSLSISKISDQQTQQCLFSSFPSSLFVHSAALLCLRISPIPRASWRLTALFVFSTKWFLINWSAQVLPRADEDEKDGDEAAGWSATKQHYWWSSKF